MCQGVKQSAVSKWEHTHTVDIELLICVTVCSKILLSVCLVIKHMYSPPTPTPTPFTYTRIISIRRQVGRMAGWPPGLTHIRPKKF